MTHVLDFYCPCPLFHNTVFLTSTFFFVVFWLAIITLLSYATSASLHEVFIELLVLMFSSLAYYFFSR